MKKYLNNLLRMSELINIEFDPWVDILLVELDLIRREITSNEKVSQKEISERSCNILNQIELKIRKIEETEAHIESKIKEIRTIIRINIDCILIIEEIEESYT